MKNKKAILMLGVLSMVISMAMGSAAIAAEGSADDAAAAAIAERKAQAESTGEYTKVTHAFYTLSGIPSGVDRIEEAMNEILREKLGLEVDLVVTDVSAYSQDVRLMLTSGEKMDWFVGTALGSYSGLVNDGYLYDLEADGLLDTYGAGIKETIHKEYLDACRTAGVLYSVPTVKDFAVETSAVIIGKEYLDAIGYEYEEVDGEVQSTWEEIEDIYTQLHEAFPDKTVYAAVNNILARQTVIDDLGNDYFGALLYPDEKLEVEDVFASDVFYDLCSRLHRWNQKGFIAADAITDDTSPSSRVLSGSTMSMISQAKPGYKTQVSGECGREMIVFVVGDTIVKSTGANSVALTLNQNCEDPVAAMQYMNLLYTDPELSNLLVWGQEGIDYKILEDGHITFADGVTPENAEYYLTVNWELPNSYIAHSWEGDPLNLGEVINEFNDNAKKSLAMGFTFDNSEYAAEYAALKNVYDQYIKQLTFGFVDPDEGIPEFEEALKAAGLERYMEAKAAALEEWSQNK